MADSEGVHDDLRNWRRIDDLEGLHRRVHRAIRVAEKVAFHEDTETGERLRACSTIIQGAHAAVKLHEARDLERRIERLEGLHDRPIPTNGATT